MKEGNIAIQNVDTETNKQQPPAAEFSNKMQQENSSSSMSSYPSNTNLASTPSYSLTTDLDNAANSYSGSMQPPGLSRGSSPSLERLDATSSTCSIQQRPSRPSSKPPKRSRSNTPTNLTFTEVREQEDREAGVSSRQRRKSNAGKCNLLEH